MLVSGCATLQTQNIQPGGLRAYKRVYVEPPPDDEFQVTSALIVELSNMGFEISGMPIVSPTDNDLLVTLKPVGGWDMTRYLQSLQIRFIAAKSGRLVSSSSFYSKGLWRGVKDERLKAIFNDIRKKNGYPLSKQFP